MPPISDGQVIFPPDPYEVFNIGFCLPDPSGDTFSLVNGAKDVLTRLGTENNYKFNYKILSGNSPESIEYAINNLANSDCDLICPIGTDALAASLRYAKRIPVVMMGVIDYTGFMYRNSENEPTRDFTGVSSLPNTELVLSTLIEATDKVDGVGLLYSLEDTQSAYQMQRLEQMLNQAKIPWKEYALEVPTEEPAEDESEEITEEPKEPELITDDDNTLPKSIVRTPRRSINWTNNPKVIYRNSISLNTEQPQEDELEKALAECSALFIPKDSLVSDLLEEISETAVAQGIATVTNDSTIGKYALVSTYSNPYQQGCYAGEKIYEVLVNQKSVQEVSISEISLAKSQKLYSRHFAQIIDRDFPKSFREASTFIYSISR